MYGQVGETPTNTMQCGKDGNWHMLKDQSSFLTYFPSFSRIIFSDLEVTSAWVEEGWLHKSDIRLGIK